MRVIKARNVNHALRSGLELLADDGVKMSSRSGDVIVLDDPVTTVYARPTERVLFADWRDANPFFHLFESIWMLAGSDDATWLDQFIRDFSARFGEGDGRMWGAYGNRWRRFFMMDQLEMIISRLRYNNSDRRVVLQMWSPENDLYDPADDPGRRDLPCNTQAYFRVRHDMYGELSPLLDMTVCCRSNDVLYGAYGANAVHFSVLQEYMASALGLRVGKYWQVSNNYHVYVSVLEKMIGGREVPAPNDHYIGFPRAVPIPMVSIAAEFLSDCERFVDDPTGSIYANSWFAEVAVPMFTAHRMWKSGEHEQAVTTLDRVAALDWRIACQQWLARRTK